MPNKDLQGKYFNVPEKFRDKLGSTISYENMKKKKSELESSGETESTNAVLQWLNKTLKTERDTIYNVKKTRMDAGEENQFKKTHSKDKANADPTRIRLPKPHKGSIQRQIVTNKVQYESYESEINCIKYLIEYLNNDKKTV